MRFDWNDEIPVQVIQGIHPQESELMRYKVRGNWFDKVLSDVEYCDRMGWIDGITRKMFNSFVRYMQNGYKKKPLTTREDIQMGNSLLDGVIYDLER